MALKSTNIANTLLQTLAKLTSQGENINITKDTAKPIATLITVCTLLVDSAETVGEATGEVEIRERTFEFASKIREEIKRLEEIRRTIEVNPNEHSLKGKLIQSAKNIAFFTTELATVHEDALLKKVVESAKQTAQYAKALIGSIEGTYDDFFEACKNFGGASLGFAKLLQEVGRKVEDKTHQEKVVSAYNSIKEIGPQMIRAAKRAYENPKNMDTQQELHLVSRTLVGKISYAISVSQPDGGKVQNEISVTQPTIPLPNLNSPEIVEEIGQHRTGRRKTIREPTMGGEILQRAKTATATKEIEDTIEQASMLRIRKVEAQTSGSPTVFVEPTPIEEKKSKPSQEEDAESIIISMEKEFKQNEGPKSDGIDWKSKYEEILKQNEKLKQENELLLDENNNLSKVVDSMKKRLAIK